MKTFSLNKFEKLFPLLNKKEKKFYKIKNKTYLFKKVICEICNLKNSNYIFQNIGKNNFNDNKYEYLPISICKNCGHKFLSPRPIKKFYKQFFNYDYGKTFHGYKNEFSFKKLLLQKKRGEMVYDYFSKILSKKGTILDHGCSTGVTSLKWEKKNWEVHGIDPHKPSVLYGKKNFKINIKLGYGENLKFKNNFFDVVLSLGSLEHCHNLNKSLSEIFRVLKPSGHLIIRWRKFELKGSPIEYFNSSTLRYFNKYTWHKVLKKNRLKIIKTIDYPVEGYQTFEYLVVRKVSEKEKIISFKKKKYSFLSQIKYYFDYEKQYRKKCISIRSKELLNPKTKFKKKVSYIKKNKIKLMNLGKYKSINRYFHEIKKYINYFSI